MLMFLPCVVLLFNVYYTWLIGGGLWCDIKFLSALSFFPLLHSATTAALILSHRILSFRRFRLRFPSSRYFAHHPLWGAGRVIFFPFCHTSTQNYLYCTLKPNFQILRVYLHPKAEFFQRTIRCTTAGDIRIWGWARKKGVGGAATCVMFLLTYKLHTHAYTHYAQEKTERNHWDCAHWCYTSD